MKRSEADKKYKWDFSHLFKNDEAWKAGLQDYVEKSEDITNLKGTLNNFGNFKKLMLLSNEEEVLISKLSQYLRSGDLDTTDERYMTLESEFYNEYLKISTKRAWIAPELKSIGEEIIIEWIRNDSELKQYKYNMRSFFRSNRYLLSEQQEELLNKVAKSRGLADEIYTTLAYADKNVIYLEYEGKKQEVTESLVTKVLETSDPIKDQELRREISILRSRNIIDTKHSFAKVYENILQASVENVKIRGYENTLQASLFYDNVEVATYTQLLSIGKEYIDLYRKFIKIKKSYFNLKKFYVTDSSLVINQGNKTRYDVETAIAMVKASCAPLGDEYLEMLDVALLPGRIDFYEDTNKRSGAYSSSGNGVEPIILMNWDDSIRSVATLAHELGHSVHTLFSNKYQPANLANYPILLAEVASTFNEHLLFDYLYQKAENSDQKIYLLEKRISDIIATFFRQIQFAKFEYVAHQLVENEKPLNADILAELFHNTALEYGYDVFDQIQSEGRYSWPRILHFFNSPYYVYKYATSIVTSFKLYDSYLQGDREAILNFIKAGGHKEPTLILKDSGVNLEEKTTYIPLMKHLKFLIDELEKLVL